LSPQRSLPENNLLAIPTPGCATGGVGLCRAMEVESDDPGANSQAVPERFDTQDVLNLSQKQQDATCGAEGMDVGLGARVSLPPVSVPATPPLRQCASPAKPSKARPQAARSHPSESLFERLSRGALSHVSARAPNGKPAKPAPTWLPSPRGSASSIRTASALVSASNRPSRPAECMQRTRKVPGSSRKATVGGGGSRAPVAASVSGAPGGGEPRSLTTRPWPLAITTLFRAASAIPRANRLPAAP